MYLIYSHIKKKHEIEDETDLLLDCQRFSSMRAVFLSKIETKIDDIH